MPVSHEPLSGKALPVATQRNDAKKDLQLSQYALRSCGPPANRKHRQKLLPPANPAFRNSGVLPAQQCFFCPPKPPWYPPSPMPGSGRLVIEKSRPPPRVPPAFDVASRGRPNSIPPP